MDWTQFYRRESTQSSFFKASFKAPRVAEIFGFIAASSSLVGIYTLANLYFSDGSLSNTTPDLQADAPASYDYQRGISELRKSLNVSTAILLTTVSNEVAR
jgi:hypothetical protein